jgi:threonyl-tRNA synthetase
MERFVAILIEHTAGKFPLWLSPQQVKILPISEKYHKYAEKVLKLLKNSDIRALIDYRSEKTGRKIRDAELERVPYMIIVGAKEEEDSKISVRQQGEGDQGVFSTEDFIKMINDEVEKIYNI